jgi:hypothetical protein
MKSLQIIKNFITLCYLKKDKVITTCLKNDIPLTDNDLKEMKEILQQKKEIKLFKKLKHLNKNYYYKF